jgi:hypothetical protein
MLWLCSRKASATDVLSKGGRMRSVRWKLVAALAWLNLLRRKPKPRNRARTPFGPLIAALATSSPLAAHQALPSSCDRADPATCLYTSDLAYDVGEISGVSLTDSTRSNYQIQLIIRYPVDAPGPRPVVVWHHGGHPSPRGATRSEEWSRKLAGAGYVLVHPSRTLVSEHSFVGIDRPFMFITGVGDKTGEPPEARVTAWLTSAPGYKALVWDTVAEGVHETMDIDRCDTPLRADHCAWLGAAGLAFLDAVLRERPQAQEWLRSNAHEVLSSGTIELHRR